MAFTVSVKSSFNFDKPNPTNSLDWVPANNSLLIAVIHCLRNATDSNPVFGITDSLGGTWTQQAEYKTTASYGTQVTVFTRKVTTGASMHATMSLIGGNNPYTGDGGCNDWTIFEVTGHDDIGTLVGVTGANHSNVSTGYSLALSGTSTSTSAVFGFLTADGPHSNPGTVPEGSGATLVYKSARGTSAFMRATGQYIVGAISSTAFGAVGSTAYDNTYIAMEIKASTGGGVTGTLGSTEAKDVAAIAGSLASTGVTGTLGVTEAPDIASLNGGIVATGTLGVTEAKDIAAINGGIVASGTLASTEAPDIAAITGNVAWNATLGASEAPDAAAFNGTVVAPPTLITFRSQNFVPIASANPMVCSPPSGIVDGDILIATAFGRSSFFGVPVSAFTPPAGWTQIDDIQFNDGGQNFNRQTMWWKRASGESGNYTFSNPTSLTGYEQGVHIGAYYNCVASGTPIDVYNTTSGSTGVTVVSPSLTTNFANDYLIQSATSDTIDGGGSWGAPAGMTLRLGGAIGVFEQQAPTAGATGTRSATTTNAFGQLYSAFFIALKPFGALTGASGTLAATEAKDLAAFTGSVTGYVGTLAATEAPDTALLLGAPSWNAILAATEATDTALINGNVAWSGTLAATEASDIAAFAGSVGWTGTLVATEAKDTALINGGIVASGTLAVTEAKDISAINGGIVASGPLTASEAPDICLMTGTVTTAGTVAGSINTTETPDTALINGTVTGVAGALVASEAPDVASITGKASWSAVLAVTEARDTAIIVGASTVPITGTIAISEAPDTALITGSVVLGAITGILAASEARDMAQITGTIPPPPERRDLPGVLNFGRRVVINRW